MSVQPMQDLPRGARFVGPDGRTEYKVVTPASEHPRGWVDVVDKANQVCGFFAFAYPTNVEVLP